MNVASIRRAFTALLLSLLSILAPVRLAARSSDRATPTPTLTMSEYVAQLDALASAIDQRDGGRPLNASVPGAQLPSAWRIENSNRVFEIPLASLRLEIRDWAANHDPSVRQRLQDHVRTLRSEAAAFQQPPADRTEQRAHLADILSTPDFDGIHGPTWVDRLRQRLLQLATRWLGGALPLSIIPTIGRVVVFALIAVAILAAGYWARRLFKRTRPVETSVPIAAGSSNGWAQCLVAAQDAAARGDWRDAVHFTYWCAVAFLEDRGAWRPDPARTPREYLRLLPSSAEHAATLAALTQRFEPIWYGTASADARSYAESLADLKSIGCPAA
jgi:hypothetical protein